MTPEGDIEISDRRTEMKYIPLVALLLYQTIAIGAEKLPAFKTQVTPYNAPQTILAQLPDAAGEAAEAAKGVCEDNASEDECLTAPDCIWDEEECIDADDDADDDPDADDDDDDL